jgi:hypothetical protein
LLAGVGFEATHWYSTNIYSMKKIRLLLPIPALVFALGCSSTTDYAAKTLPSNTPMTAKVNVGQLLDEAGLNNKGSAIWKLLNEQIKEAEESGYPPDELPMMKLLADFSSTGLDSKNPVHLWLLPTVKKTKGEKGDSDSYLHLSIGISVSIENSAQAEKKLQELAEQWLYKTERVYKTGRRPATGAVLGGLLGGVVGHNTKGKKAAEGAVIGALGGALLGGALGNSQDKSQQPVRLTNIPAHPSATRAIEGEIKEVEAKEAGEAGKEKQNKPLPWIQQKGYKALIASGEASGYRAPDGSRQSIAIGLSSKTLVVIIQTPLEGNGPTPGLLAQQWIQKEEEKESGATDSEEEKLEKAAQENHRAELLKMLDERMNTRSKPKGSLGTYLSTSNDLGAYSSLEKVTDEWLPMFFEGSGIPVDWEKDEKEPQESGLSIKSIKQSHARFSMDSLPGGFSMAAQVSNPMIKAGWVGKGLDQAMLNAIPRDAAVIGGFSLGKKILNKTFLKETLPGILRGIDPNIYHTYDRILDELKDMEEEDTGWKMDDLITMIEGTIFIAISPKEMTKDQNEEEDGDQSTENVIIGIKISNPNLFTEVYGALKAGGHLKELREEKGIYLVNKGNYVFLCARKFKKELEKTGRLSRPLAADLQKDLLGETAVLWANLKVASKMPNFEGGPWNSNDEMDQALTAITETIFFTLKISEGKAAAEARMGMSDDKTPGLRQLINALIKPNTPEENNGSDRPWNETRGFQHQGGGRRR